MGYATAASAAGIERSWEMTMGLKNLLGCL